jgi:hypothetical protein
MKLKSLLIGSAAVVAAASGARAADAVVMAPAPEPMEYVRVCDVYGAGFFYIPGTETCLKIGGYIFYEMSATSRDGLGDTPTQHVGNADEWRKYIRTRVFFDARSETAWGTLRGYIQMQTDYTDGAPGRGVPGFLGGGATNDPDVGLDEAWLSLGGFRAGYAPSAFTYTVNGGPSGYGTHSWNGLYYGYSERQFIQYNFTAGNGLFATVSLESDPSGFGGVGIASDPDYIPDVVGKIGITQGWGTVWGTVGVDEDSANTGVTFSGVPASIDGTGDTEWAASAGIFLNIPGMVGDSLKVVGYYASDPNAYWAYGDWSVLGSYYHQFTPTFGASVGGQYIANTNYDAAGDPNLWLAELNLVWTPVVDFEVRSEITYAKETDLDGSVSGFVRFTRYFGG